MWESSASFSYYYWPFFIIKICKYFKCGIAASITTYIQSPTSRTCASLLFWLFTSLRQGLFITDAYFNCSRWCTMSLVFFEYVISPVKKIGKETRRVLAFLTADTHVPPELCTMCCSSPWRRKNHQDKRIISVSSSTERR